MAIHEEDVFGGISGIERPDFQFEFGNGITLVPTEAYLMRPCLMTFRKPDSSFPAMQSAGGSFGFDIVGEIHVPKTFNSSNFDRPNTIWWLAALLRLHATTLVRVPVLTNKSFSRGLAGGGMFLPVESESERTRMLLDPNAPKKLSIESLQWIREHWIEAGQLMDQSREFNLAMQAFDKCSFYLNSTLSLLLLWGGIEGLFLLGTSELKFRVSTYIACFLEQPGDARSALQKKVAKLYDARSAAAHGRADEAETPLIETYALMKRILIKIIEDNYVPKLDDLDKLLFGAGQ